MDVSENNGTPKSSILIGFSIINHPFWGILIFGNTHNIYFNVSQHWTTRYSSLHIHSIFPTASLAQLVMCLLASINRIKADVLLLPPYPLPCQCWASSLAENSLEIAVLLLVRCVRSLHVVAESKTHHS